MSDASTTTADTLPWRFSIRTLLVVVTVVCVLLAPYHWLGFSYLFSLALSVTLIACSVRSYVRKWQTTPILLSAFGAFSSFCIGIGSIVFLFHSICNLIGSVYADFIKPKPRNFAIILAALAVIPYAIMIGYGVKEFNRIGDLRLQYPVKSLTTRLLFENSNDLGSGSASLQLDTDTEQRLIDFEQRVNRQNSYRAIALSQLHNDTYRRFAAAEGFGPARMVMMIPRSGRFSDFVSYSRDNAPLPLSLKSKANTSASMITDSIHIKVLDDFFKLDSFGDVKSSSHVIGFEPHGPSRLNVSIGVMDDDDTAYWQLTRLELVSLLRHEEPRVYVAEMIPLMNELESVPHRAPNEFEIGALPQLETQRDTVIEETPEGAVMLGAVRAGNDCLQCHNGPRGRLLGAFSYEFRELK